MRGHVIGSYTKGNLNDRELRRLIEEGEIDTVIVAFPDQFGRLMGKRLTGDHYLKHGAAIESCNYLLSASIELDPQGGFPSAGWEGGYGDYRVVPAEGTPRRLAWPNSTAIVLGDLYNSEGVAVAESPRTVLQTQCDAAAGMGLRPMMASELEFFLFRTSYRDALDAPGNIRPSTDHPIDYDISVTHSDEGVIGEFRRRISAAGIPVESSKGETGPGQYEIALAYTDAMEMADRHILFKSGMKAIAEEMGRSVTFMAKYAGHASGSSGHIHLSLYDQEGERNLFWDGHGFEAGSGLEGEAGPEAGSGSEVGAGPEAGSGSEVGAGPPDASGPGSETFRHFLGGLTALTGDLFLFFAPTVNSYHRYREESFAPTRITWGYDNRTVAYRVVGRGGAFRIENRLPGADVNPYLAYAATLGAGMYGIRHKLEPGAPFTGNTYDAMNLPSVPRSLREAAERLNGSAVAREIFGDRVVDHYVRHAVLESDAHARDVSDWEVRRYFRRI